MIGRRLRAQLVLAGRLLAVLLRRRLGPRPPPGSVAAAQRVLERYARDRCFAVGPARRHAQAVESACLGCAGYCEHACPVLAVPAGVRFAGPRLIASALGRDLSRYEQHRAAVRDCLACGLCTAACPARIAVPALVQALLVLPPARPELPRVTLPVHEPPEVAREQAVDTLVGTACGARADGPARAARVRALLEAAGRSVREGRELEDAEAPREGLHPDVLLHTGALRAEGEVGQVLLDCHRAHAAFTAVQRQEYAWPIRTPAGRPAPVRHPAVVLAAAAAGAAAPRADGARLALFLPCHFQPAEAGAPLRAALAARAPGIIELADSRAARGCCGEGSATLAAPNAALRAELARRVIDEAAALMARALVVPSPCCAAHLRAHRRDGDPAVWDWLELWERPARDV